MSTLPNATETLGGLQKYYTELSQKQIRDLVGGLPALRSELTRLQNGGEILTEKQKVEEKPTAKKSKPKKDTKEDASEEVSESAKPKGKKSNAKKATKSQEESKEDKSESAKPKAKNTKKAAKQTKSEGETEDKAEDKAEDKTEDKASKPKAKKPKANKATKTEEESESAKPKTSSKKQTKETKKDAKETKETKKPKAAAKKPLAKPKAKASDAAATAGVSGEESTHSTNLSAHENTMNNLLQMSLDALQAQCKQDKSMEKMCDKDFWTAKFESSSLPMMQIHNTFAAWLKEYTQTMDVKTEIVKLLKVGLSLTKGSVMQLRFKLPEDYVELVIPEVLSVDPPTAGEVVVTCHIKPDTATSMPLLTNEYKQWYIHFVPEGTDVDEETETLVAFSDVLQMMVKIQYLVDHKGLEVTIESKESILSRKDLEETELGGDAVLLYRGLDISGVNKV